ncbi:MAG TPA: hypothetical protein GXX29_03450 [Firmicutes bacterium]|nr:hypothetical protein [Bacillota bacterium]
MRRRIALHRRAVVHAAMNNNVAVILAAVVHTAVIHTAVILAGSALALAFAVTSLAVITQPAAAETGLGVGYDSFFGRSLMITLETDDLGCTTCRAAIELPVGDKAATAIMGRGRIYDQDGGQGFFFGYRFGIAILNLPGLPEMKTPTFGIQAGYTYRWPAVALTAHLGFNHISKSSTIGIGFEAQFAVRSW